MTPLLAVAARFAGGVLDEIYGVAQRLLDLSSLPAAPGGGGGGGGAGGGLAGAGASPASAELARQRAARKVVLSFYETRYASAMQTVEAALDLWREIAAQLGDAEGGEAPLLDERDGAGGAADAAALASALNALRAAAAPLVAGLVERRVPSAARTARARERERERERAGRDWAHARATKLTLPSCPAPPPLTRLFLWHPPPPPLARRLVRTRLAMGSAMMRAEVDDDDPFEERVFRACAPHARITARAYRFALPAHPSLPRRSEDAVRTHFEAVAQLARFLPQHSLLMLEQMTAAATERLRALAAAMPGAGAGAGAAAAAGADPALAHALAALSPAERSRRLHECCEVRECA